MSDTVKLIIEIPRNEYEYTCDRTLFDRTFWDDAIRKGILLDDVKAEIEKLPTEKNARCRKVYIFASEFKTKALEILDNIGKTESEDKE